MSDFDMHVFVSDRADEYALGTLAPGEIETIDAHVRDCSICARLLGEVEEAVIGLIEHREPSRQLGGRIATMLRGAQSRRNSWQRFAFAAGFVLAILGMLVANVEERNQRHLIALQSTAMTAMLHGHFIHAQFATIVPGAPLAKVVFAREKRWLYIIVEGNRALQVVGEPGDVSLGTTRPFGSTSTLFVPYAPGIAHVILQEGAQTIEQVRVLH